MDPEEEFLITFFSHVSQLNFDKAKERLNSLRSIYDASCTDYRRLEDVARSTGAGTIATVANQLSQFCMARVELIDFYERMYVTSCGKQLCYQELSTHIEDLAAKHAMSFSHMTLTSVKATFSLECEVLVHLLRAQLETQHWRFLHALMQLHGAHTRVAAWERSLHSKESWTLGFGATFLKTSQLPGLFQWLLKLKAALVAKFSLYFYCTLAMQTVAPEMKALCSRLSCDYYHKMQTFQRRYDASAVMLVFDAHDLDDFPGPGYHLPDRPVERLSNLHAYPIVISCPVKPLNHIPNVAKVLSERAAELAAMDKVIFYFSEKEQSTYALALTDPRMSLVVIFDSKKTEKDSFITNFVSELSQQLRCHKVISSLKLSAK
ncbi:KICSTOR subunit 2-like isoform X2 [Bacillus rossius redtenbacheri]|uniref:KICSTOR subunit 2-like isoform X2 n=1 Tax=Bacillus rossius redtenbacheri TaxID=93214 RepID=UPI002FDE03A8